MLITYSFKIFGILLLVTLQLVLSSKEKSFQFFEKFIILKLQFKKFLFCQIRQYYSSVTYSNVNVSIRVRVCSCRTCVRILTGGSGSSTSVAGLGSKSPATADRSNDTGLLGLRDRGATRPRGAPGGGGSRPF